MPKSHSVTGMLLGLVILGVLATAAAAGAPGASTGEATQVTHTTAVLNGVANPNKEETTAYFEYGTTTAYGTQTPQQAVGGGNAGKDVSAQVTGLAASTTYHFRLVTTNASGTDLGQDKTFTTPAPGQGQPAPHTVSIAANPTTVLFGRTTAISGKVTGPNAAGADVTLEHTPAPFTAPFAKTGVEGKTDAAGNYTLTASPTVNTRYQVTAKTSPPVTSPATTVNVRPVVTLRVSDSRIQRPRRIRFSGVVRPAHDGLAARIQRRIGTGRYRTVATVALRASTTAGQSTYARRLRVRRTARYRVVLPAHADHVRGRSPARRVRVL